MRPTGAVEEASANGRPRGRPRDALDATPGGLAERLAQVGKDHHPVTVAIWIALVGAVLIGAIMVGIGLLLTHVLVHGGVGSWDERVNNWFVEQRTPSLNAMTDYLTLVGSTVAVVAVGLVSVIVLAIRRLWREVGVIVVALSVEVSVFLTTTLVVGRPRPTVPQLDPAPPTSSFPSGHTAAAVALWIALAIVVTMHVRNAFVRALVWIVAVGLPILVGLSRLYRGMHHPTDVLAGVLLGIAAILTAVVAVRTASGVHEIRGLPPATTGARETSVEVPS
jgi:membrane-associated phospholipid phosphatase